MPALLTIGCSQRQSKQKTRTVFLSDKLARLIRDYMKQERGHYGLVNVSPYLFLSNRSPQLSRLTVFKFFTKYSAATGIRPPISPARLSPSEGCPYDLAAIHSTAILSLPCRPAGHRAPCCYHYPHYLSRWFSKRLGVALPSVRMECRSGVDCGPRPRYDALPMERFWTLILLGTPHETPRWAGGNARRRIPKDALPEWFPD